MVCYIEQILPHGGSGGDVHAFEEVEPIEFRRRRTQGLGVEFAAFLQGDVAPDDVIAGL